MLRVGVPMSHVHAWNYMYKFPAIRYVNVLDRLAGNFQGRKLSRIGDKYDFREEIFRRLLAFGLQRMPDPQISQRKLSQIATKP